MFSSTKVPPIFPFLSIAMFANVPRHFIILLCNSVVTKSQHGGTIFGYIFYDLCPRIYSAIYYYSFCVLLPCRGNKRIYHYNCGNVKMEPLKIVVKHENVPETQHVLSWEIIHLRTIASKVTS